MVRPAEPHGVPPNLVPRSWPPRRVLAVSALAAWVVICVVGGAYMLASHLLTLPTPAAADPVLHQAIAARRHDNQRNRWLTLHVVLDECRCSQRVLEHLLNEPRPAGVIERVVLVSENRTTSAATVEAISAHGFDVDVVTPDELVEQYHIEVAPLLVIIDPHDSVRYVGGYTPLKQSADIRDVAVITATLRGETAEPLPTFGCVVGRALRAKLDPLGVR